jgi:hypothetical protein
MLNRSKLWAAGFLLAVFAAGGAVGGAVTASWGDNASSSDERRHDRNERSRRGGSYAERLEAALGLNQEQRATVDTILDRQQTAMRDLWTEYSPRFDSLRQDVRSQIMEILDEGQQEEYRELVARSDRRRDREGRENDNR